ncbi:MAG: HlyD family efflux transporter periplasmic adaptor subunit [Chloroflexi bacterium]|nr:HlyD family efflux transporter periplasmic adaptor subunit [Chloroflexota bacterium]
MKRRRWLWISLLVVILAGAGGYAYYANTAVAVADEDNEEVVQTATARVGDLVVSATGAGTIIPAQEIELSFSTNGTLTELLVQIGDSVQVGDLLARVEDADAQQALVNAQIQLTQSMMQTDASSTEVGISYDDISVEQAEINLAIVQAALDDLLDWEPDEDAIAAAEAALVSAEASYNAARGQEAASSTNISVNRISVDQAERSLADAQDVYDTAFDPGRDWELGDPRKAGALEAERDGAAAVLLRAQENLQVAQLNFNASVSSTNVSSSTNAQSGLLSAQQALETAQTGPDEDEIEAAGVAVRQAELSLQQVLLNREANQLSLTQAELTVDAAQLTVDGTNLLSPINGTVTAVNASIGENVSSSVIILADLEQPMVEVFLDETDLGNVGMGFEVEVIFDALPDDTFIGHIVQVAPELVVQSGVTAVRAVVELDAASFSKPQTLPVGLNATVEVIGGRAEGAVLVPVEAVRELSPGEFAVFVMENDEPKLRFVEVGLMDFSFAEISSGLEAGEIVTTGLIDTE